MSTGPVTRLSDEPCPWCGCPAEQFDGHACEDYQLTQADAKDLLRLLGDVALGGRLIAKLRRIAGPGWGE